MLTLRNLSHVIFIVLTMHLTAGHAANTPGETSNSSQQVSIAASPDNSYLNGGIGVEEASAMRLKAAEFPLRMLLSQGKDGRSIVGANISIRDSKGQTVFELTDAGPMLYVKLPAGSYTISAEYNASILSRPISIAGKKGLTVYLNWKVPVTDIEQDGNRDSETVMPGSSNVPAE